MFLVIALLIRIKRHKYSKHFEYNSLFCVFSLLFEKKLLLDPTDLLIWSEILYEDDLPGFRCLFVSLEVWLQDNKSSVPPQIWKDSNTDYLLPYSF